jgi:hypothetical protein
MLGHVHYTAAEDSTAATTDSNTLVPMRVLNSSWVIASSDSNPVGLLSEAMGFNRSEAQVPTGNEWGMIYPGEHVKLPSRDSGWWSQCHKYVT